jgi:hypothetical protein
LLLKKLKKSKTCRAFKVLAVQNCKKCAICQNDIPMKISSAKIEKKFKLCAKNSPKMKKDADFF